ncbi:MAG: anhydro-N-acetylmuramic acid kinase [Campylobacterota bacterium]|nr:anhydro-N-acetylmuramic acid kinase [Campylobacterota bacterium]
MKTKELYIGLMSGTSLDGVDAALCMIDEVSCELVASLEYPIPDELKIEILAAIEGQVRLAKVGELDHRLGLLFAKAVNALLEQEHLKPADIKAIGSHGQTVWHEPAGSYPFTMQLGDPNIIAVRTGISVVADFRRKDVALGGQGAPFAPAFHKFLFGDMGDDIAIVNIGGMANITLLGEKLIGYDTGCGNVLMDMWIAKCNGLEYDRDGLWAKSGRVDYPLLERMLDDDYFRQEYPKSTGREKFNAEWLESIISQVQSGGEWQADIQRTLLELTAITISNEVLKFQRDILLLCGGGAKNSFLVERIKAMIPNIQVVIAANADSLEAMAFAWLAYKRIHKEPVNLKDVTGAKENSILGGIYE